MIRSIIDFFFPRNESMQRKPEWGVIIPLTYLVMMLVTFGHVTARHPQYESEEVICEEIKARDGKVYPMGNARGWRGDQPRYCSVDLNTTSAPETFIKSAVAAIGWPLFWSWHLQAEKPHG